MVMYGSAWESFHVTRFTHSEAWHIQNTSGKHTHIHSDQTLQTSSCDNIRFTHGDV